jgi:hypothetical protein
MARKKLRKLAASTRRKMRYHGLDPDWGPDRRAWRGGRLGKRRRTYAKKRKQPKRGCGKRNWRKGGNAMWKCKRGKRRYYKTKR